MEPTTEIKNPFNPSKKAIARVKNPLPPITTCQYCNSSVSIQENKVIYGKNYGDYPWTYVCDNLECRAYVGMHPFTAFPLGTLADYKTREARKSVKKIFINWYTTNDYKRNDAYLKLSIAMGIEHESCHFGWFDVNQCNDAKKALMILTGRKPWMQITQCN